MIKIKSKEKSAYRKNIKISPLFNIFAQPVRLVLSNRICGAIKKERIPASAPPNGLADGEPHTNELEFFLGNLLNDSCLLKNTFLYYTPNF